MLLLLCSIICMQIDLKKLLFLCFFGTDTFHSEGEPKNLGLNDFFFSLPLHKMKPLLFLGVDILLCHSLLTCILFCGLCSNIVFAIYFLSKLFTLLLFFYYNISYIFLIQD